MKSLRVQLRDYFYFEHERWTVKGDVLRVQFKTRKGGIAMPTTIARTINLMESDKELAVRPHVGGTVEYRLLPIHYKDRYITWSERPNESKNVYLKRKRQRTTHIQSPQYKDD